MNNIVFEHVVKAYGKNVIVNDLNMEIREGERLILLGPSGCGKSTTLRMIAGLEDITSGFLHMRGQVVNNVACGDRGVSMVFQNYALFPHMTVKNNIIYGLKAHKMEAAEINRRLEEVLEMLQLKGLEDRKPKDLSGGQRQRVAIMYRGNMEMLDTPSHVYNMPASIFCARFIGSPSMNIISCQYENGNLSIGDQMIRLAPMWRPIADACPSGKYCVGIRPEHIVLSSRPTETSICGTVKYVEDYGNRYGVYIDVKGEKSELIAICNDSVPRPGENIFMNIDFRKLHLFDAQSEKSLGYPEEIRRLNAALDFSMPDAQNKNQKTGGKYHESFGQYQCV